MSDICSTTHAGQQLACNDLVPVSTTTPVASGSTIRNLQSPSITTAFSTNNAVSNKSSDKMGSLKPRLRSPSSTPHFTPRAESPEFNRCKYPRDPHNQAYGPLRFHSRYALSRSELYANADQQEQQTQYSVSARCASTIADPTFEGRSQQAALDSTTPGIYQDTGLHEAVLGASTLPSRQ
ncbi:hypothetical protein MYU51_009979 [Penicillium brevicompactum]|uniref:uncharacterized protein n=1 Tax=Penicillium brevicompactum TaxID=5074 RepID=UPI00253F879C|nr:uncharacterized protein N7506_009603 [Penicillium brevicompactum]KAJ5326501.1 hypothetical protein N7506_009603 [Penicillium brevicompactum]